MRTNHIAPQVEPDNVSGFIGAFGLVAIGLTARGLIVFPVGKGADGKEPYVNGWAKRRAMKTIEAWSDRFASCGIGIATGPGSRLTVVDIDDAGLVDQMLARFGDTPVKVRTPRGGMHLYYRHNGEGCSTLRETEALAVEIKGAGGYIVAPPTVRLTGPHAGKAYTFISGGWDDIERLPQLNREGLRDGAGAGVNVISARAVERGRRNDTLFRHGLRLVKTCTTFEALFTALVDIRDRTFEADPDDAFPDAEVRNVARSVWRIEAKGNNLVGTKGMLQMAHADFTVLVRNTDALALGMQLRFEHGARAARGETFALSPKGMAKAEVVPGWTSPRRYRQARDFLVDVGFIEKARHGGRGKCDPHLFRLTAFGCGGKGAISAPNVIEHPPVLPTAEQTATLTAPTKASSQASPSTRGADVICIADLFDTGGTITLANVDAWSGGMMPPELVAAVRRIARARGLTHEGLARIVGCSRPQLSNILVRKFGAGSDVAARLRDFLKTESMTGAA